MLSEWVLTIWAEAWPFVACAILLVVLFKIMRKREVKQIKEKIILQNELETVGLLQDTILRIPSDNHRDYSIKVFFKPAMYAAGDWYAQHLLQERWLVAHVGDVTGHGAAAALNASFARGCMEMYSRQHFSGGPPSLSHLHTLLNQCLYAIGEGTITMTLVSVILDVKSGQLSYLNSGHVPPLVYSVDTGKFGALLANNPCLLGVDVGLESHQPEVTQLSDKEMLLLQTDGVSEVYQKIYAPIGKLKGTSSLSRSVSFLSEMSFKDPHTFCAGIDSRVAALADDFKLEDDATIMAMKLRSAA